MLALDFKLTSGQVRALLFIYAHEGTTGDESRQTYSEPVCAFFRTPMFITCATALKARGLVVHRPWTTPEQYANHETIGHFLTADGRACAQLIISQSRHIAALAEFVESRNAKRKSVKKRTAVGGA